MERLRGCLRHPQHELHVRDIAHYDVGVDVEVVGSMGIGENVLPVAGKTVTGVRL